FFFFQAEDGIRDFHVTGVQTCALPICFCAGGSLFGSFLLSRRILENWVVWIIVDVIYLYLYISKELYLTTLLYTAYIVIAIIGYREWKKNWQAHLAK